jgi:hypothetical protein
MSWTNSDGLLVKFGTEKGTPNVTGTHAVSPVQSLEIAVDWEDITSAASHIANVSVTDAFIPAGSYIKTATLVVTEAWTSAGSATLGIGLCQSDASTVIDADGIDAAIAKTALAADDGILCDGALVGGVATVGSADAYVYFTTGTAAWTAGSARIVIEYVTDGL